METAVMNVGPDLREIDELKRTAWMTAGFRIGEDGIAETLATEEIISLYQRGVGAIVNSTMPESDQ